MTTLSSHFAAEEPAPTGPTYKERIAQLCATTSKRFRKVVLAHSLFRIGYLTLAAAELVLLILFFPFFMQSAVMAYSVATLFLTLFSYFALRLYLQAKRPEQMADLRDHYVQSCKSFLQYQEGIAEHHLSLANATCRLASELHDAEQGFLASPTKSLQRAIEKLSCWLHWRDVLAMRELLLFFSIDEYIKLVRCEPTNLEIHAALANAYVLLSGLYVKPEGTEERWSPGGQTAKEMNRRFRVASHHAIEEFHILRAYAPDDPWVHTQLAYSYRDLQMPQEEIHEYEKILRLTPGNTDVLFKLGMRYFQQGMSAKGLQVYDHLKKAHFPKAEELLLHYGMTGEGEEL